MPRVSYSTVERIRTLRTAWRELAPDATFAGMTFEQFEVASKPPLATRTEERALTKQLEGRKTESSLADDATSEMLDLVVNSVRGTPGFGQDCGLQRAFGYVRKSERKSSLTRSTATPPDNANAA